MFAWWGSGGRLPQWRLPDDPPVGEEWSEIAWMKNNVYEVSAVTHLYGLGYSFVEIFEKTIGMEARLWVLATPVDGTLVELVLKSNPQLLNNLTTPKPLEEVKDGHDPDVIPKGRPIANVDAVTSRFTLAKDIPDPM